jgi:hypothetical protein
MIQKRSINLFIIFFVLFSYNTSLAINIKSSIGVGKQIGSAWDLPILPKNQYWQAQSSACDVFIKNKITFSVLPIIQAGFGINLIKYNSRIYQQAYKSLNYKESSDLAHIKSSFESKYSAGNYLVDDIRYGVSCISFEIEPTISIYFLDVYCGFCINSHKQVALDRFITNTQLINEKTYTGKIGLALKKDFQVIGPIFAIVLDLSYELHNIFSGFTSSNKNNFLQNNKNYNLPLKHFVKASIGASFNL